MKALKTICAVMSAAVILQPVICLKTDAVPGKNGTMREITTMELVRDMGIGINLGNTMEACGDWIAEVDEQW